MGNSDDSINKRVTFTEFPERIEHSYYDLLRKQLITHFSRNRDVISLYEYGSVKAAGFSDLDLILICKDKISGDPKNLLPTVAEDPLGILDSVHLMTMPRSVFSRIQFIDPVHTKLIWGNEVDQKVLTDSQIRMRDTVSVIDWLPERLARILRLLKSEEIPILYAFGVIYSFRYTLMNLTSLYGLEVPSLAEDIRRLRQDWFSLTDPELQILGLLKDACTVGHKMLERHEIFIMENELLVETEASKKRFEIGPGMRYVFDSLDEISSLGSSTKDWGTVHLPRIFLSHFLQYASFDGHLAQGLRSRLSMNPAREKSEYADYQRLKLGICEENARFILENGLERNLFRFGFWL